MVKFKTKRAIISSRVDRIDLLADGTYEVINYKTGKSALEPGEMARDLQAITLYQGANSHKRFEGKISRVSFYYLRPNRKVSLSPSVEDVKEVTAEIDRLVRNIESLAKGKSITASLLGKILPGDKFQEDKDEALAEKGALCGNCEYLEKCPAWPVTPREIADETPEVFGERIRLSYSKLSSYKRCPRAWKKSYLDGLFSMEPRPFFSFGTALHEAMENFYSPHGAKKGTLKHLLALWDEAFNNNREGYRNEEEAEKYYQKGVEQLEKYHAHYCADGKYRPAYAIEEYFAVPLGQNAVMTGFIDRIDQLEDGTYEILDYKTEPTMRKQEAVDEDDQLTIYFWACETLFDMKIKQLSLLMTNFDKKITTTRRTEDIPEVVAAIDAAAAEIKENTRLYQENFDPDQKESEYFPPKKNKYCKSCDFLHDCPLRPEIEGDTSIRTMEYDDQIEEKPMPTLEYE